MSTPSPVFLHHNRGVKALKFTMRQDRQIKLVRTAAFNRVVEQKASDLTFIVTKGICAQAVQLGRIKLTPYTGRFPVLTLIWRRVLEVVRG